MPHYGSITDSVAETLHYGSIAGAVDWYVDNGLIVGDVTDFAVLVYDFPGATEAMNPSIEVHVLDGMERDEAPGIGAGVLVAEALAGHEDPDVSIAVLFDEAIQAADDGSILPEDEGEGAGLLRAVGSSTEYRYFSVRDMPLSYMWHGAVSTLDPVKLSLPSRHGGFLRVSAGQVTFMPTAFGSAELWSFSHWPPPKELAAFFRCKSPGQSGSTRLFDGKLFRSSMSESGVVYDVYISSFTETIASGTNLAFWASGNSLLNFFEKVAAVLDLTLDSSRATADPPDIVGTISTERLVIDVASEVAAFCGHLFWIDEGTLFLQDMDTANGELSLADPNDYFRSPEYTDEIPVNRIVAGSYEYIGAEYPYGVDYALPVNYTGDASQLQKIYGLMNTQWTEVPIPASIGCGEFVPGKVLTVFDPRLAVDSEAVVKARSVSYDFMLRKVTIGGHCSINAQ